MSTNIINFVKTTAGQDRKDINKILELITDFTAPAIEDSGAQERITVSPEKKIRSNIVTFSNADLIVPEVRDRVTEIMRRYKPVSPLINPLSDLYSETPAKFEYLAQIEDLNNDGDVTNAYRYLDLSNISDYVIQAGDYLEYDIMTFGETGQGSMLQGFDLEFDSPSGSQLRGSGITDQNGLTVFGDHSAYSTNKWYHRKFDLTGGAFNYTGYNCHRYLFAQEGNWGTWRAWYRHVFITNGAGTIRKTIFNSSSDQTVTVLHNTSTKNKSLVSSRIAVSEYQGKATDTKFGAGFSHDGCSSHQIADDPLLNVTDKLTIVGWFKLSPTLSGVSTRNILYKSSQYLLRIDQHSEAANRLSFFPYNPTAEPRTSITYTPNTWFHYAVVYNSSTGTKAYVNGVETASQTDVGALATTSNPLYIFAAQGDPLYSDGLSMNRYAWISLIHNDCSSTWINNHMNGILDTTGANVEILTLPLRGTVDIENDCLAGLCSA